MTRHLTEKSAAEDQASLGPMAWAAGSQSELTPSESLATSDGVRQTDLHTHTHTCCLIKSLACHISHSLFSLLKLPLPPH